MKHSFVALIITLGLLLIASCGKQPAATSGPSATVILRDGTRFAGMVTNSSPTSVTVAGEGNNSRTFDMKDVRSIEYGEPEAVPPTDQRSASSPAPARPQPREL